MKKKLLLIVAIFFLIGLGYAQKNYSYSPAKGEDIYQSKTSKGQWEVLYTYDFWGTYPNTTAAFYWEGKVYTAALLKPGELNRFNISGKELIYDGSIAVDGTLAGNREKYNFTGFTTDGTYIYAVNKANMIYKINPKTWKIESNITISYAGAYKSIAYDKKSGNFWAGTDMTTDKYMRLFTVGGIFTQTTLEIPTGTHIMGLAYDDVTPGGPYLITAVGSSNKATLGRFNIDGKNYEADIKDVSALLDISPTGNFMGSIFPYNANGRFCLLGVSEGAGYVFACELSKLTAPEAPAAVTNLSITPNATGALTAVLNWTNPNLTIDGKTLTELTAINIYENNNTTPLTVNSSSVLGIGASCNYTVTVSSSGMYSFTIACENSEGEGLSTTTIQKWIGPDVPAAPTNVQLVNNNMIAHLSWSAPTAGLHSGYFSGTGVSYDIYRFPGNVQVSTDQTETTFTDEPLEPGAYYYKIVAKNAAGEGGSANSMQVSFCPVISTFTWAEGFENGLNCWEQEQNGKPILWNTTTSEIPAQSGAYCAYIGAKEGNYTTKLISPVLNISALSFPKINFSYYPQNWVTETHSFAVYYRTSSTSNWIQLQLYSTAATSNWYPESLSLPNPSATYQIAFEFISGNLSSMSNNMGVGLDIIEVYNDNPTCPRPTGLTVPVSTITSSQAIVNWTEGGSETSWIVEYRKGTNSPVSQNVNNQKEITLSNLDANTEYYVRVKAVCDAENKSDFTPEVYFKTLNNSAITEYDYANMFALYPNPTTGKLTIENGQLTIKNVEVFDMLGKKQLSIINCQLSINMDVSPLPAGVYFVRLDTETGLLTKKLIKK